MRGLLGAGGDLLEKCFIEGQTVVVGEEGDFGLKGDVGLVAQILWYIGQVGDDDIIVFGVVG